MFSAIGRSTRVASTAMSAMPLTASQRCFSTFHEGKGYVWGAGEGGDSLMVKLQMRQLTNLGFGQEALSPEPVLDGAPVRHMAFGVKHGVIVDGDGNLHAYGENKGHKLGLPGLESVDVPTKVSGIDNVVQAECGHSHTIALTVNGDVYTWGTGGSFMNPGALGHAGKEDCKEPCRLEGLPKNIVSVAAGDWFNMVLTEEGEVWTWGRGENGVLGTGSSGNAPVPIKVEGLLGRNIESIQCGPMFSGAVTDEGELWMWGKNDRGQLAQSDGVVLDVYNLEAIPSLVSYFPDEGQTVGSVSCGSKHSVACTDDEALYQWGMGQWMLPHHIRGDDGAMLEKQICQVGAGARYSAAVDIHGHLYTWGAGESCCLGHGDKATLKSPVAVAGFGPEDEPGALFGPVTRLFTGASKMGVIV